MHVLLECSMHALVHTECWTLLMCAFDTGIVFANSQQGLWASLGHPNPQFFISKFLKPYEMNTLLNRYNVTVFFFMRHLYVVLYKVLVLIFRQNILQGPYRFFFALKTRKYNIQM